MTADLFRVPGTAVLFDSTGSHVTFTPKNTGNNAGRYSARGDIWGAPGGIVKGADAARLYAEIKPGATPTVGNLIRIYYAWWDDDASPGDGDNQIAATDTAVSSLDVFRNWKSPGAIEISAASSSLVSASWLIPLVGRYLSVGIWNASGATLTNAEDHYIRVTPLVMQVQ